MSQVDPIECHEAAEQLYEYLDGELPAVADAQVRVHLADCAHCFDLFDFETAYLRFLEARSRAQGAPPELRRRILDELLFKPGSSATP